LLWQVVVSFGDDEVHVEPTFEAALSQALRASAGGRSGGGEAPERDESVEELVREAAEEFRRYREAFGTGDFEEAARRLEAFQAALDAAERAAGGGPPEGAPEAAPAGAGGESEQGDAAAQETEGG
jgi:hypothetical protein